MKARWIGAAVVASLGVLAVLSWSAVRTLDSTEVAVAQGGGRWQVLCGQPGPCWHSPLRQIVILERRQQWLRLSGESLEAADGQQRLVDVALLWRVSDVPRYLAAVGGSMDAGAERLRALLRAALPALDVADEFKAGGPARRRLAEAAAALGVSVGEPRLLRMELTEHETEQALQVAGAALKARSQAIREQGERDSQQLRAAGEQQRDAQLATTARDAGRIRGSAEAEATRIYAAAYGKDPQFADFFRSLEAYRRVLGRDGDLLVITPDGDFFRYLQKPTVR